MSNKLGFNVDEELELLRMELEETDKIFEQVKPHFDRALNNKSQGAKFITDQTSNLMNIRSGKVSILKEIINLKKLQSEMRIKEINLNKDEGGENSKVNEITKKLYEMMKKDNKTGNITTLLNIANNIEEGVEVENDTDAFDKRLKALEDKKKAKAEAERLKAEEEARILELEQSKTIEESYVYVCDLNGKLYALDNETEELVENVPLPDYEITISKDDLTEEYIATNQHGEEIIIIEIDEE